MKKNTFYLIFGCIALALLFIFWYSVELHTPFLIEIAFIIGIVLVYLAKRKVTDHIDDERDVKITEQATIRTMQVFWVVFCAFSIGAVMQTALYPEISPRATRIASSRPPWPENDRVHTTGSPLPDGLPLCWFQDLLREKIWRI